MEVRNKRLSDEEFFKERKEVLAEWPTGKECDLDEAIEYHKSRPPNRKWYKVFEEARQKGEIYPQSGMGHTTIEQEIELLKHIRDNGGGGVFAISVDTFTRNHDFKAVERGIKDSERAGTSVLNGYPVVNHGVAGMRKVVEAVNWPMESRYGASDPRIIHEIMFAGGIDWNSGGLINFFNYSSKWVTLEQVIHNCQYVWRLEGYYQEKGVPFCDSPLVGMSGGGPSLGIAGEVLQTLLMAEQGIKYFLISAAAGCLAQGVAACRVNRKLFREYLDRFGYKDVAEPYITAGGSTAAAGSIGRMPTEPERALAHICMSCLGARLCQAQVAGVRNISEAGPIAIKEEIAESYRCANTMISLMKGQRIELDNKLVNEEAEIVEREAKLIINKVIELGDGDVAIGIIRAVESGVLDNSFSSHPSVACKVMGVRDADGMWRYLDHGNLPFTKDIIEYHKQKIAERSRRQGREVGWKDIVIEHTTVGTGYLEV